MPESYEQIVDRCRHDLITAIEGHRATCPVPNCGEVGNVLAFLAHSMGVTQADLHTFQQQLLRYELYCRCPMCADGKSATVGSTPAN